METCFRLEDPTRIEPGGREQLVEVTLPDGLLLRGYVDRLDVAGNGALRVVNYRTGSMPREAFEGKALFQMKFYALVPWRTRGVVASQLKLIYLGDSEALTYAAAHRAASAISCSPALSHGRRMLAIRRPSHVGQVLALLVAGGAAPLLLRGSELVSASEPAEHPYARPHIAGGPSPPARC